MHIIGFKTDFLFGFFKTGINQDFKDSSRDCFVLLTSTLECVAHGGQSRGRRTTDPDFNMIPTTLVNNHQYSAYDNQSEKNNQSVLLCCHLNLKASITTALLMKYVAHGISQDPSSDIELRCCAGWCQMPNDDVFRSRMCLEAGFLFHAVFSNVTGKFHITMAYPWLNRSIWFSVGSPSERSRALLMIAMMWRTTREFQMWSLPCKQTEEIMVSKKQDFDNWHCCSENLQMPMMQWHSY